MSLDIHTGSSNQEAERKLPDLVFTEKLHNHLFYESVFAKELSGYDYFIRLKDYYSDVTYLNEEISNLKNDLEIILSTFDDAQSKYFLNAFIQVCIEALTNKVNIYVYAD